jgi:hypothetical protein
MLMAVSCGINSTFRMSNNSMCSGTVTTEKIDTICVSALEPLDNVLFV